MSLETLCCLCQSPHIFRIDMHCGLGATLDLHVAEAARRRCRLHVHPTRIFQATLAEDTRRITGQLQRLSAMMKSCASSTTKDDALTCSLPICS